MGSGGRIRIPHAFYWDHWERGLPSPRVVHETKAHLFILAGDPAVDELLSDAEHYSSGAIDTRDFPHLLGLVSSARATVKAIKKGGQ